MNLPKNILVKFILELIFYSYLNVLVDARNIIYLNGSIWLNQHKLFKNKPEMSAIARIKPKAQRGTSSKYETEIEGRYPQEMIYAMKPFLNGKALMILRRKDITKAEAIGTSYLFQMTVMNLDRTTKLKYVRKKTLVLGSGDGPSGKIFFTNIYSQVTVTGKHGNILILYYSGRAHGLRLMLLNFSKFGDKLLSRYDCPVVVEKKSNYLTKASPDSRFLYVCVTRGMLGVFEIMHERSLVFKAKYEFAQSIVNPPLDGEPDLRAIFCYNDKKLIVLLDTKRKKEDLKFLVYTYKEDKEELLRSKVKNADKFTFRGDISFYRKKGKIYFFDQKKSVFRLNL